MKRSLIFLSIFFCIALLMSSSAYMGSAGKTESKTTQSQTSQKANPALEMSNAINTEDGPVRGELLKNSTVFRGIPYAAPPVGNLRWRPPQPPDKHIDPIDAINFGSPCAQPGGTGVIGSEDCLSLNIWSPKSPESKLRPVMFFIHGGGNVTGSADFRTFGTLIYDGQYMTENSGVIVVTINYRLGTLGFFAHASLSAEDANGSSGNYGLLDQIFALQWVQRNISNFGGDPNNVTIFGESAGGRNVLSLVSSPLATGLFHKAIVESGAPLFVDQPLKDNGVINIFSAEDQGSAISQNVGCENSGKIADCLRSKTPEELIKATPDDELGVSGFMFGPNVDGYVLARSTPEILQSGIPNNVPIMIGTNKNEFLSFIGDVPIDTVTDLRNALKLVVNDDAKIDQILAKYPISDYGSPRLTLDAIVTDRIFYCPSRTAVRLIAPQQPQTYFYQFTHVLSAFPSMGSFHGLELPFVFHSVSNITALKLKGKEKKLTDNMTAYWTNFAKTGDPNGGKLPNWPVYTNDGDKNIVLDNKIKTNTGLRKDFCDFLSQLLSGPTAVTSCGCGQSK